MSKGWEGIVTPPRSGFTDWGDPVPLYGGDALVDLHNGQGTRWIKDPRRGFWPDCCDLHRPQEKRQRRR